jgi:adenosylcobinamide kinase/adenosylcobinamide-phosphate guanylyltransferase
VLGGARSGKSATAERMLASSRRVDYVATGTFPGEDDPAWGERVRIHQQRRPAGWSTFETLDVEQVLSAPDRGVPVLLDCLATWLAGVMDECGLWTGEAGAGKALASRVDGLVEAWQASSRHVVAVSNEVGLGVVPGTFSGVRFRDELGTLNARIAAHSHEVWFCAAGIARRLR